MRNLSWGAIRKLAVLNAEVGEFRGKCPYSVLEPGRNLPVHPTGIVAEAAHQKIAPPADIRAKRNAKFKNQKAK